MKAKAIIQMDLIQEIITEMQDMPGGMYVLEDVINWLKHKGGDIETKYLNKGK